MTSSSKVHDTLVYRLSQILTKLNRGESLEPLALAEEFGVNLRTIQRDLNVRFACLPLKKTDGRYRLESAYLGKLTIKDISQFAALSGVSGLFPQLSEQFLRGVFDTDRKDAWVVKGHHYEDLRGKGAIFTTLEQAIVEHRHVQFTYNKAPGESKFRQNVEPYKMINQKGIWYLAAWDAEKLKAFTITKIDGLLATSSVFTPRPHIEAELAKSDGIWLGVKRQRVVLRVAGAVADYFKRRQLIPNQHIEREFPSGDILVSASVAQSDEIIPIVRYWLPNVRIVEPSEYQRKLESGLAEYLAGCHTDL